MKGALPDFGAIIVTVDTKDGVPVSARTRSTRGPMVSKLLEGRQADESIPSLISILYTLQREFTVHIGDITISRSFYYYIRSGNRTHRILYYATDCPFFLLWIFRERS